MAQTQGDTTAQTQRRTAGRPVTAATEGQKATLGIRASADLKTRLFDAASRNGRSLSAEAETRLELSLHTETVYADAQRLGQELMYSADGAVLMQLIGRIVAAEPRTFGDGWTRNPTAYALMEKRIAHAFAQLRPKGDPEPIPDQQVCGPIDRLIEAATAKITPLRKRG
jgi:hypothetical protein